MKTIKENGNESDYPSFFRGLCIAVMCATVLYAQIIQYKFFAISNGMLILGILLLITYMLAHMGRPFTFSMLFSKESAWVLAFFIYIFPLGWITSPNTSGHITQWITSIEYFFLMIILSSLIMHSGTETFHVLLLLVAIIMAVILFVDPVLYPKTEDRYSISTEINPNALGMAFTTGIWAALYFQQKKKISLAFAAGVIAFLCYSILKTGSRKALIAAGIIILLWVVFCFFPSVNKSKSRWKPLILLFSTLALFLAAIEFIKMYSTSDMAARMDDLGRETTTGSRAYMYEFGWMLFQKQPLFGLGFTGFQFYHGLYSHATVIEVPVSAGIFGSIIYFASYFISIKKCISLFKYSKDKNLMVENEETRMLLILWAAMLFYCTCIIHPYQFDSFIMFGIIFGQSTFLEKKIRMQRNTNIQEERQVNLNRFKYIR